MTAISPLVRHPDSRYSPLLRGSRYPVIAAILVVRSTLTRGGRRLASKHRRRDQDGEIYDHEVAIESATPQNVADAIAPSRLPPRGMRGKLTPRGDRQVVSKNLIVNRPRVALGRRRTGFPGSVMASLLCAGFHLALPPCPMTRSSALRRR